MQGNTIDKCLAANANIPTLKVKQISDTLSGLEPPRAHQLWRKSCAVNVTRQMVQSRDNFAVKKYDNLKQVQFCKMYRLG